MAAFNFSLLKSIFPDPFLESNVVFTVLADEPRESANMPVFMRSQGTLKTVALTGAFAFPAPDDVGLRQDAIHAATPTILRFVAEPRKPGQGWPPWSPFFATRANTQVPRRILAHDNPIMKG